MAERTCEQFSPCCAEGAGLNKAVCEKAVKDDCDKSLSAPGVEYRPEHWSACINAQNALAPHACAESITPEAMRVILSGGMRSCDLLMRGKGTAGEPCGPAGRCDDKHVCDDNANLCKPYEAPEPLLGEGAKCTRSDGLPQGTCDFALYCDFFGSKTCKQRKGLGDECTPGGAIGLDCAIQLRCDESSKKCVKRKPEGHSCKEDFDCTSTKCSEGKCVHLAAEMQAGVCGPNPTGNIRGSGNLTLRPLDPWGKRRYPCWPPQSSPNEAPNGAVRSL